MKRIPDILIERVLLGEATSEQRARVLSNPTAKARLEELRAENAAFLEAHPPREIVGEIQQRVHLARTRDTVRRRRDRWMLGGMVLAAGAAVGVAAISLDTATEGPTGTPAHVIERTTPKGPPQLLVYRRIEGKTRTIQPGVVLRQGDLLRLGYRTGRAEHGMLVSIDGRGEVTLHAPDDHDTTLGEGQVLLPHAYQLDDAPDFERFFFVTSDGPFDVDSVLTAAKALSSHDNARSADLELPRQLAQQDFTILKDVP